MTRITVTGVRRRCRVCEARAMSDQDLPPDEDVTQVLAPSGLLHLIDRSGYTFCGKNSDGWYQVTT